MPSAPICPTCELPEDRCACVAAFLASRPTEPSAKPTDAEGPRFEAALPALVTWLVDEGCSCDEVGHEDPEPDDHRCTAGMIEYEVKQLWTEVAKLRTERGELEKAAKDFLDRLCNAFKQTEAAEQERDAALAEVEQLREQAEMACLEPADNCPCAGCEHACNVHGAHNDRPI